LVTSSRGARNITKDTQISDNSSPGSRKGGEEQKGRHTGETHVEKERTGSRLSNAKKERMKRSEKRGDCVRERGETQESLHALP